MAIQVLPPQLANQIAAGEVVERPSSVVKELVENSLDAGATRIDIDIERGGAKLIRVRDNGCGIKKEDLVLALARHATSKITTLDDLEAIVSLGFRGEALASISSVSRLTLTSRTTEQDEAWLAYAEGRDQAVVVKPAAHPVGSTIEVLDLFYNTPARRKFLRTEKTEFSHIDEIVRRIALARFDVAINLNHNGKLVRQYRPAQEENQRERRLAAICGTAFLSHAHRLTWQHGELAIQGWIASPIGAEQCSELQYCYVNGRMMRDRLISHAIRQAYQESLQGAQQPAYVLYLEVDPRQVDVNVHPTKQEVRFHQARLVHDFIYQAVTTVLAQINQPGLLEKQNQPNIAPKPLDTRPAAGGNYFSDTAAVNMKHEKPPVASQQVSNYPKRENSYQKRAGEIYGKLMQDTATLAQPAHKKEPDVLPAAADDHQEGPLAGHSNTFGRVLMVYPPCYALLEQQQKLAMLNLPIAEYWLRQAQLIPATQEGARPQPLLIPIKLMLAENELIAGKQHQQLLIQMGITLQIESGYATLRAVPLPLRQQNLQQLIPELLSYLAEQQAVSIEQLAAWLAEHLKGQHESWNCAQVIQLLTEVERLCPQLVKSPPANLLQYIDLQATLVAFSDG